MNLQFGAIVAILFCVTVSGLASFPVAASGEKTVSMVYMGEKGDYSYLQRAFAGLDRAEQDFSFSIRDIPWNSSSPADPVTDANGTRSDAVIIMGAIMNGYEQNLSAENPDLPVILIDGGLLTGPAAKSINFSMYGTSYLAGILAANQTKTKQIGIVAGVDAPVLRGFTDGFIDGAHREDPEVRVTVSYIAGDYSGFSMPDKAGELTSEMYRNGTDIIYQIAGSSVLGVINTAKTLPGLYVIGSDADQSGLAPDTILASAVKNLDPVIYDELDGIFSGTYTTGSVVTSLEEGGTSLTINPRYEHLSPLIESRRDEAIEEEKKYLAAHRLSYRAAIPGSGHSTPPSRRNGIFFPVSFR